MIQWADAVKLSGARWGSPWPFFHRKNAVRGRWCRIQEERTLGLDVTLRAHAASHLHQWVSLVLDAANPTIAATLAARLRREGYPIYITRDLDAAREYVRRRFAGETQRRYGLLASSRAKNLDSYGIDPGFQATRRVKIARWFNDGLESPEGGCHLDTVITQFQCQGLELDLPIVCWGDDFWWSDGEWCSRVGRRQRLVRDPHRLITNAYRVLLTRGREGVIIFVPTSRPKRWMLRWARWSLRGTIRTQ